MIRLKEGVKLNGLQPQMLVALHVVEAAFRDRGWYDVWITSANDSVHMAGSLHYKGLALDFRTKHVQAVIKKREDILRDVCLLISTSLPGFDVILEDLNGPNEHLHIEWDPK